MALHYGIPNYISRELEPAYRHTEFGRIESHASLFEHAPFAAPSRKTAWIPLEST